MNRCLGYTIKNKKCRKRINYGILFCCDEHKPINKEIIDEGCNLCMDMIFDTHDLYNFRCRHAFHKTCYDEWCNFSTYANKICIICRKDVLCNVLCDVLSGGESMSQNIGHSTSKKTKQKMKKVNVIHENISIEKIHHIAFLLNK